MAAASATDPLACPSCGYRLKFSDTFDVPEEAFEGNENLLHCICYLCGNEWVE